MSKLAIILCIVVVASAANASDLISMSIEAKTSWNSAIRNVLWNATSTFNATNFSKPALDYFDRWINTVDKIHDDTSDFLTKINKLVSKLDDKTDPEKCMEWYKDVLDNRIRDITEITPSITSKESSFSFSTLETHYKNVIDTLKRIKIEGDSCATNMKFELEQYVCFKMAEMHAKWFLGHSRLYRYGDLFLTTIKMPAEFEIVMKNLSQDLLSIEQGVNSCTLNSI